MRAAGFDEKQAEAVIGVLAESHGEWDTATRRDLREVEAQLRAHVSERVAEAKVEIIKWVAGMLLAQAALIAALVKLL